MNDSISDVLTQSLILNKDELFKERENTNHLASRLTTPRPQVHLKFMLWRNKRNLL